MTKKHYNALAKAWAHILMEFPERKAVMQRMVTEFIVVAKRDNPAFRADFFWNAVFGQER